MERKLEVSVKNWRLLAIFITLIFAFTFIFFTQGSFAEPQSIKIANHGEEVIVLNPEDFDSSILSDTSKLSVEEIDLNERIEVIERRTYNSQTFKNPDGSFVASIYSGNVFFYDGEKFEFLEKLSSPKLEKKEINLSEIPESNIFDFGTYEIHKGINISIEGGELVLRDANDAMIKILPRPFSYDSNDDFIWNEYVYTFENNVLQLNVEVDESWLQNATYPVVVDPTVQLTNASTGTYEGMVRYWHEFPTYIRITNWLESGEGPIAPTHYIGAGQGPYLAHQDNATYRGFIEFNTSTIPDNANVSNVVLNITISKATNSGDLINITRFNVVQPSNKTRYPLNSSGNEVLFTQIITLQAFFGSYIINSTDFQSIGNKQFDLGTTADSDLESLLSTKNFFAVGFVNSDNNTENNAMAINNSRESPGIGPKLDVTYTIGSCSPPGSGDWTCNQTCTFNNEALNVDGDLHVQDSCLLTLQGTTDVDFDNANSFIYVYPGGEIRIEDTAGFNKG